MKLNCFILRTTTVAGLGVPIFRVFTVYQKGARNIDKRHNTRILKVVDYHFILRPI